MADQGPPRPSLPKIGRNRPWLEGLSPRLLLLTILFVMLGAGFIIPPALAAFEEQWLLDRVRAAELASLAADVAPDRRVTRRLSQQLLAGAGVVSVVIQNDGMRRLVLAAPSAMQVPYTVDLGSQNPGSWLSGPFRTLMGDGKQMVRVIAQPRFREGESVEIITPDGPLKRLLLEYAGRLIATTLFVASLAGLLVYLTLNIFLVRPMQRITLAMEKFRANPEDPQSRVGASGRADEIGRAEAELTRMQTDLLAALQSKARLASLGEAVAKINHDLRNMLTSAQMASDRLAALGDPKVAQALPRLERALDRAINLASEVLAYGKSSEAPPVLRRVALEPLLEAAAEDAGLTQASVRLASYVDSDSEVLADPDHLHRILVNLMRNARESIEAIPERNAQGVISATLARDGDRIIISLADDGPGIPERALANLFQPFAGSVRRGGTGLGLAIARELAQGHGGDVRLVRTGSEGSVFEILLPVEAPDPQ
jgi:signal transduction histidine kinase